MGSKRFDCLWDWVRWGLDLELTCEQGACNHRGVVAAHDAVTWFRLHRWSDAIEGGALRHFRCHRCGAKAGHARPTNNPVTVTDFFPADEQGWKVLQRRLRG